MLNGFSLKNIVLLIFLLLIGLAISKFAIAQEYEIIDLGTLDNGDWSSAYAINNFGQVVGYSSGEIFPYDWIEHAFIWSKEEGMIDLGNIVGEDMSWAWDINDLGQVDGGAWVSGVGPYAFLWTKKTVRKTLGV